MERFGVGPIYGVAILLLPVIARLQRRRRRVCSLQSTKVGSDLLFLSFMVMYLKKKNTFTGL